jgi:hypothetical protein
MFHKILACFAKKTENLHNLVLNFFTKENSKQHFISNHLGQKNMRILAKYEVSRHNKSSVVIFEFSFNKREIHGVQDDLED